MVLNMKTVNHNFVDFSKVVSNTVPGRCYSIAELLNRVMRGQPLPQVGAYEEDRRSLSDNDIDNQMSKDMAHPFFERDSDEIEASAYAEAVDGHVEAVKQAIKKKS